jgi:hypothetical protein
MEVITEDFRSERRALNRRPPTASRREAQPAGNGSPCTVVNTRRLRAELARGRYGVRAVGAAGLEAPGREGFEFPPPRPPVIGWHALRGRWKAAIFAAAYVIPIFILAISDKVDAFFKGTTIFLPDLVSARFLNIPLIVLLVNLGVVVSFLLVARLLRGAPDVLSFERRSMSKS